MNDTDSPSSPSLGAAALIAGLAVVAGLFALFVVGQRYWIDDSFISFRYARNWVEGHGLVFNAGAPPVEGYTNFLWLALTSLGMRLGFDAIHVAQALSVVAQGITLMLTFALARSHPGPRRAAGALIAPLLLVGQVSFLVYPMTGMETTFFTMLVTAGAVLLARGRHTTTGGRIVTGLVLAALSTARFDGFVLAFVLIGARWLVDRDLRSALAVTVVIVVALAGYHAWRVGFYPTALPNTFHAKTRGITMAKLEAGVFYVGGWVVLVAPVLAMLSALGAATGVRGDAGGSRSLVRMLGVVVAVQVAYVIVVGGDWMPHKRFLVHVLPLVAVLAGEGLLAVLRRVGASRAMTAGLVFVVFVATLAPWLDRDVLDGDRTHFFQPEDARTIGVFLDRARPADDRIAIEWAGILPFHCRQPVLDTFGITDRVFAEGDHPADSHGRWIEVDDLVAREPDLIVPACAVYPTAEAARAAVAPGGPSHYRPSLYPKVLEHGYRVEVFEVAPGAFWAAYVR